MLDDLEPDKYSNELVVEITVSGEQSITLATRVALADFTDRVKSRLRLSAVIDLLQAAIPEESFRCSSKEEVVLDQDGVKIVPVGMKDVRAGQDKLKQILETKPNDKPAE